MTNKKFFFNLAATALMGAALSACSSDLDNVANADRTLQPIQLKGSVQDLVVSRAADTELQGDALKANSNVGLFVVKALGESETNYTTIENGKNTKLTVGDDGKTLSTDSKLYWEESSLYFYAYAPYSSSYDSKLASTTSRSIDFTVKADQSEEDDYIASDLLFGVPTPNPVSKITDAVTLGFTHKLSKVIVKVTTSASDYQEVITLNSPGVALKNITTNTSMDLTTGTLSAASSTTTGDVKLSTASTSEKSDTNVKEYEYAAIVVPQTLAANTNIFEIKNNGETYYCQLSDAQTLESGKVYTFTVTFTGKSTALTTGSSTTNWTDGGSKDTTAPVAEVTYEVGDYLLSDGSLMKSNATPEDGKTVIGVIFSTDLSSTDKGAGYTAYVLGTYVMAAAAPVSTSGSASELTAVTSITNEWAALDGLSATTTMASNTDHYPLYGFTQDANSNALPTVTDCSRWFVPSIGQMFQILTNLGKATIPATSDQQYYLCLPNLNQEITDVVSSDGNGNYVGSIKGRKSIINNSIKSSEVVANLNASANGVQLFSNSSSVVYTTSTMADTDKPFMLRFDTVEGNDISSYVTDGWGFTQLTATNARKFVVCIATKAKLTND